MAPRVDHVTSDEQLPSTTDVVIIGGGIIGVAAALTLAERGLPVVLCEKGQIGAEQSSRNWGWCRQQGRDPRELPLIIESLRLWRENLSQARQRLEQLGYDDYFYRLWEFYLCYCEGGFLERTIGTAQLLLAKPGCIVK